MRLSPCLLLVLVAAPSSTAFPADLTRIPLVIDEPRATRSVPWPVTTGVPFPQGRLARESQCRLVDDRGDEQPLQSRVAATWDAARSSVRWLTIDFIAQPGRRYALEFGPSVSRRAFPSPLALRDEGGAVSVDTGPLRVELARRGPAALRSVSVDRNSDGRIGDDERIAGGPSDGDHVLVDHNGQAATGARDGTDREVAIEGNGPVRGCVRVDGWYTGPDGKRIVGYRTRYHVFAGLPLMKVVDEFRIVGSTRGMTFREIALPLDVKLDAATRRVSLGWDNAPEGSLSRAWGDQTQSMSLAQETYRHYGNTECRAVAIERTATGETVLKEGEQAGAWIQAADDRACVTGSLRWFWQQFPKEWELTRDRLVLKLWSPRGGPLDFGEEGLRAFFGPAGHKYLLDWGGVRAPQSPIENFFYFAGRHALARDGADGLGINKHHEAWYHFGPASQAAAGRECGALADRPPLCLATGEWNVSTGVFGPLAARPNDSPYEAIVDRIFDLERYAQDAFGDYGWWLFGSGPHYSYQWDKDVQRHYADPRRFEYHTYQRETQLWWSYFRSGERKFYDWAIPSENHWVDVAVAHTPTKFSTEWRGGARGEATLHFPAGDWSIDSPLHYVRHHDTGEAWLRSASQFWGSYHRTLETTTLAYYLTGDERYNDVVNLWRDYWAPLAGVRSDAADVNPWHREQLWFQPTKPGEPTKSWAEMLRDYAPFQSGSRHQMTLFFSLATLFEHTWNPQIGRVVKDFADAYLDPESPNGVWQCHDHRLPANANSPMLAHYWSPALWKYARATNDPRMPGVLRKYFPSCLEADPYGEDVGVYSNVQIAWAWHFTRDPRHLVAARRELDDLLPASLPLEKPEDLGPRIYNPYDPIRTLAAVPRLIGILAEAEKEGVAVPPPPPLSPQRALIALRRKGGEPLRAVIWGWDRPVECLDGDGRPVGTFGEATAHRSHRQPFDRALPGFEVFRATIDAPPLEKDGWCYLSPKLETGLLELKGAEAVWCWGGEPLRVEPRRTFWWRKPESAGELVIESAQPALLRIVHDGQTLPANPVKASLVVPLGKLPAGARIGIEPRTDGATWFRLAGVSDEDRWVSLSPDAGPAPPDSSPTSRRARPQIDSAQAFVPGRFGQALLVVPGRELRIPDETAGPDGGPRRLSDPKQGTIEFWIRRHWDERLSPVSAAAVIENGPIAVAIPAKLPQDEWAHVAVVWRPVKDLPDRRLVHIYVNGVDYGNYRNLYWAGYSPPPTFGTEREWRKEFVVRTPPGVVYAIDDIRISSAPRHVDLSLDFGPRQTFNPRTFSPPDAPAAHDEATLIRLPLDGDSIGTTAGGAPLEAKLVRERPSK